MAVFLMGLIIFLGVHSIFIFASGWRERQVAQRGEALWKALYSVVSGIGFALLIYGYAHARQSPVVLWVPPTFLRHLALLLMLPVFVLLFAAYLPGRIGTSTKHPMLLAVKLWACAHLLANGTLVDVVLFGSFLAWAVMDRISMKRRPARTTPSAARRSGNDLVALVGGGVVYGVVLLWGHQWLIGLSPLGPR